jgi:Domain of unknown function (DUF4389)
MSQVQVDVPFDERRNRLTVAFRFILIIPHAILVSLWQYVVQLVAVVQWFITLFTGKRNKGIWNFSNMWLDYYSHVTGYGLFLYDPYPGFINDEGKTPLRYESEYDEPANRLTSGLRLIWAIPVFVILLVLGIAVSFVALVAWFAILFTGKLPAGMFNFILRVLRYVAQANAYILLMTDDYPKFA